MTNEAAPIDNPVANQLPRWARVLDWATFICLVLAVTILLSGGFREYLGPIRISVRSPDRLALLALLLAIVRHYYVRSPAMPGVIFAQLRSMWRSEERRHVWPAYVGTRLGVLLAGYLAVVTVGFQPNNERFRWSEHVLENLTARWDAAWYLGIVTKGYRWNGETRRQQNVVFFPAFPMATRGVGLLLGERWLLAGVLVSLTAFFWALIYFYRLAREFLDVEHARTAVWVLAAYPFAIYYSAPYTEACYLLGSVGCFYHLAKEQWGRAAAWGFFVALCRPNGFLIAGPALIFVAHQAFRQRRLSLRASLPVMAPVLGLLAYCVFLYISFGDPLAWLKGQTAWRRYYVGVWPSLLHLWTDRYAAIWERGLYDYTMSRPYDAMATATAVFVLVSVWPTMRRFGLAYGVFTLANILPPLIVGGMMSIGRMTSVVFPAFLWLGAILPTKSIPSWIAISCILQGLIAVLFFTWRSVF